MNNFIISLSAQDKTVNLSIKNEMGQDCYISESSIMLDGFKNDKFQITHQTGELAVYQGRMVKYYPKFILLKKDESLSNELDLSDEYFFPKSGEYSIAYYTYISCCQDIEKKDCSSLDMIGATASTNISMSYSQCESLPDNFKCNIERLIAIITSKFFKHISYEEKIDMIGEKLLLQVQKCLLSAEQEEYDLECVGKVVLDLD